MPATIAVQLAGEGKGPVTAEAGCPQSLHFGLRGINGTAKLLWDDVGEGPYGPTDRLDEFTMNAHVRVTSTADLPGGQAVSEAGPLPPAQPERLPEIPADIRISQPAVVGSVLLADVLILAGMGVATFLASGPAIVSPWLAVAIVLAMTCATAVVLQRLWGYTIASLGNFSQQMGRIAGALAVTFAALTTVSLLLDVDLAALRPWLMGWAFGTFAMFALTRVAIMRMVLRWTEQGRLARRAVIVGGGKATANLIEALQGQGAKAIQLLGLFDDRGGERSPDEVGDYRKLGRFDDLVVFCREHKVDLLIIALPHTAEARILYLLKKLWVLPIDIRISALDSRLKLRPRAYSYIGKVPFLSVFDKPLTDWGLAVKNVEDRLIAALALLMLSPVMAIVALAVKLDSKGPIFFRQIRYGFNNEKIGVFKFRSMYVDQCDVGANRLVTKGDPRVTRVGAFIRKTSLDELPQLINVLRGELSLVGPRPHAMQAKADGQIYDEVVDGYFARHKVKPGITGWAQINGWRGETDTVDKIERRVEHDLHYIDNWSVFFDLYILAMTPVSLLNTKNAY